MKKLFALLLALAMVLSLAACGASEAPATEAPATEAPATEAPATEAAPAGPEYTEVTLKFGTSSAESSLTAKAFMEWGRLLSEASGGKVNVEVYCSSVLGNNTEMIQGAQMGTIDVVVIQPAGLYDMGADKMILLNLPYLFENYDMYYNTLFSDIGDELLQNVTDKIQGLVGFSYLPDGGRCYFTAGEGNDIRSLEDIKGMKLRVQSYAIDSSTATALGFSATPTAISELYSALDTGVVDGAEQPLSAIDGNAFYEVSDYITLDNHTYNLPTLVMSEKTWNKLNAETQQLLKEKWEETVDGYFCPQLADYEAGLLAKFKDYGCEIIELADHADWVKAVDPVWAEYGAGLEDLIAQVQALG